MRLLAQFVAVLLLVGFVGAYFWWIVAAAAVTARRGWPFAHIRSRALRSRPTPDVAPSRLLH